MKKYEQQTSRFEKMSNIFYSGVCPLKIKYLNSNYFKCLYYSFLFQ